MNFTNTGDKEKFAPKFSTSYGDGSTTNYKHQFPNRKVKALTLNAYANRPSTVSLIRRKSQGSRCGSLTPTPHRRTSSNRNHFLAEAALDQSEFIQPDLPAALFPVLGAPAAPSVIGRASVPFPMEADLAPGETLCRKMGLVAALDDEDEDEDLEDDDLDDDDEEDLEDDDEDDLEDEDDFEDEDGLDDEDEDDDFEDEDDEEE